MYVYIFMKYILTVPEGHPQPSSHISGQGINSPTFSQVTRHGLQIWNVCPSIGHAWSKNWNDKQTIVPYTLKSSLVLLGHWSRVTHRLLSVSISCPGGQPQPGLHIARQGWKGFSHVVGQFLHRWNTWPSIGHTLPMKMLI